MSKNPFYRLSEVSLVTFVGADTEPIVHNLTTNKIKALEVNQGCETFITDVKGKTLGHGYVFRTDSGFEFVGARGQSKVIAAHADKYTIREDCVPVTEDQKWTPFVFSNAKTIASIDAVTSSTTEQHRFEFNAQAIDTGLSVFDFRVFRVPWLGENSCLVLVPAESSEQFSKALVAQGMQPSAESEFHIQRTAIGFPWYGVDIDQKNLPQEADRDPIAISFTKGCYLGQETVARLDALGQVQRKLVRWKITGGIPITGDTLSFESKVVGRLTSIATTSDQETLAIGYARRSHFEPGSTATGNGFEGTVL